MPDILIRMEMPQNCMVCDFRNRGFDLNGDLFCNCRITKENVPDYYNIRMENCPLHELPEHGDLISKDDAMNAILGEPPEAHYPVWYAGIVNEMPVIVPSNKEPTHE